MWRRQVERLRGRRTRANAMFVRLLEIDINKALVELDFWRDYKEKKRHFLDILNNFECL